LAFECFTPDGDLVANKSIEVDGGTCEIDGLRNTSYTNKFVSTLTIETTFVDDARSWIFEDFFISRTKDVANFDTSLRYFCLNTGKLGGNNRAGVFGFKPGAGVETADGNENKNTPLGNDLET